MCEFGIVIDNKIGPTSTRVFVKAECEDDVSHIIKGRW